MTEIISLNLPGAASLVQTANVLLKGVKANFSILREREKNSASADAETRSRVCAHNTLRSAPHRH
jgi:hypothetical protein